MNTTKLDTTDLAPLYFRYDSQTSAQDAYIYIDLPSREMYASYDPAVGGGVSMEVYHGHIHRYRLASPYVSASALNAVLDAIGPLADRLADMYSSRWDGNNLVAAYSDPEAADSIIKELYWICSECGERTSDCDQVWDASDWMEGDPDGSVTAGMDDGAVRDLAIDYEVEAGVYNIRVDGMYDYLIARRDILRQA